MIEFVNLLSRFSDVFICHTPIVSDHLDTCNLDEDGGYVPQALVSLSKFIVNVSHLILENGSQVVPLSVNKIAQTLIHYLTRSKHAHGLVSDRLLAPMRALKVMTQAFDCIDLNTLINSINIFVDYIDQRVETSARGVAIQCLFDITNDLFAINHIATAGTASVLMASNEDVYHDGHATALMPAMYKQLFHGLFDYVRRLCHRIRQNPDHPLR